MDKNIIYYKSDFNLIEELDVQAVNLPWKFTYYVYRGNRKVVACYNGYEYINCTPLDDTHIQVTFDVNVDGEVSTIGVGLLEVERRFYKSANDFADDIADLTCNEETCVYLTEYLDNAQGNLTVSEYAGLHFKGDKGDKGDKGEDVDYTIVDNKIAQAKNELNGRIDNTYTKQEVNDKLVPYAKKDNVYTKQEVDELHTTIGEETLAAINASKQDYYTKGEVDTIKELLSIETLGAISEVSNTTMNYINGIFTQGIRQDYEVWVADDARSNDVVIDFRGGSAVIYITDVVYSSTYKWTIKRVMYDEDNDEVVDTIYRPYNENFGQVLETTITVNGVSYGDGDTVKFKEGDIVKVQGAAKLIITGVDTEHAEYKCFSCYAYQSVALDPSKYYTKREVLGLLPKMNGYATTSYVRDYVRQNSITREDLNLFPTYETLQSELSIYASREWVTAQNYSNFSGSYNDLYDKPQIPSLDGYATESWVTSQINEAQLGGGSSDIDLSIYATKQWVLEQGYGTGSGSGCECDLSNYYTKQEIDGKNYSSFSGSYNDLYDKPTLFNGDYNSLLNKPTILTDSDVENIANGEIDKRGFATIKRVSQSWYNSNQHDENTLYVIE